MSYRALVCFASACLAAIGMAQVPVDRDPVITYSTPAVRISTAIDAIALATHREIRVSPELDHEPIILRLRFAHYSEVMDWIATALDAKWMYEGGVKVLKRSSYATLSLKSTLNREKARLIQDAVDARVAKLSRSPLKPDLAAQTILALNNPNASQAEKDKALINSADERLICRALSALESTDVGSAPNPDHAVFATTRRPLQGLLRIGTLRYNQILDEQDVWTSALKKLSKQHPELRNAANARQPVEARSRIELIFSDTKNGLPTHVSVKIIGPSGEASVRAESSFHVEDPAAHHSGIDWANQGMGKPAVSELSQEFQSAARAGGTYQLPTDLRTALLQPSQTDPFEFMVSDALLSIGAHTEWNIVACPPDSMLLDPELWNVGTAGGVLDAPAFMSACENSCKVSLDGKLLIVKPRDSLQAEADRTDRAALQTYLASLLRTTYSLTSAEVTMATANPKFDLALLQFYAKLLAPNATPFLDATVNALFFYGSLSSEQRSQLNKGIRLGLSDLTEQQRGLIPQLLLTTSSHVVINPQTENVMTDTANPEITDVFAGRLSDEARLYMSSRAEDVVRIAGTDHWGRHQDLVLNFQEAQKVINRLGPWNSIQYATAKSNTVRLTAHLSSSVDVVNFLREYPTGFSPFGPFESLPNVVKSGMHPIKNN